MKTPLRYHRVSSVVDYAGRGTGDVADQRLCDLQRRLIMIAISCCLIENGVRVFEAFRYSAKSSLFIGPASVPRSRALAAQQAVRYPVLPLLAQTSSRTSSSHHDAARAALRMRHMVVGTRLATRGRRIVASSSSSKSAVRVRSTRVAQ